MCPAAAMRSLQSVSSSRYNPSQFRCDGRSDYSRLERTANVDAKGSAVWVPYAFAGLWAVASLLMSLDGLQKKKGGRNQFDVGTFLGALVVAHINALVLGGAMVGTRIATG
jgi:hypothetical protein